MKNCHDIFFIIAKMLSRMCTAQARCTVCKYYVRLQKCIDVLWFV